MVDARHQLPCPQGEKSRIQRGPDGAGTISQSPEGFVADGEYDLIDARALLRQLDETDGDVPVPADQEKPAVLIHPAGQKGSGGGEQELLQLFRRGDIFIQITGDAAAAEPVCHGAEIIGMDIGA